MMIDNSKTGHRGDPKLEPDRIRNATSLSDNDIRIGVDELEAWGLVEAARPLDCDKIGFACLQPNSELFVKLDECWKPWDPAVDAKRIAADLANGHNTANVADLAQRYGWDARRTDPAVNFLINGGFVEASRETGAHPWCRHSISRRPATLRFARP